MKKLIVKVVVIVFSLLIILTSCNFISDKNSSNGSSSNSVDTTQGTNGTIEMKIKNQPMLCANNLREVTIKESPVLKTSFKDDDYYYYLFDLGLINNVPLEGFPNIVEYKNYGEKITHTIESSTVETSSISNTVTSTTQESISVSVSESVKLAAEVGKKDICKVSSEYAFSVGVSASSSKTYTNSYSNASSFSKTNKTSVSMQFDENAQNGYYGYILTGAIEVYAIVVYDKSTSTYIIDYCSDIKQYWIGFYYFTTSSEFVNYQYETIPFSVPENLEIPTTYHSLAAPVLPETTYISTTPLSCKLDNAYNYSVSDPNANNIHYSHNFVFGKFTVDGATHDSSSIFNLAEGYSVSIGFRLEYDADNLPIQDNMKSRAVSNDNKQSGFYNLPWNVGERNVGKGMIVALVEYDDASPSERICITNAFEGKKGGSIVTIANNINKPCKVSIAICYELVMWAPGFLGIVDDYWMNWRINQNITIK